MIPAIILHVNTLIQPSVLGIESQPLNDGEAHLRVFFQAGAVMFKVVFFGPKQKNCDLQPKNPA
jgi:hypothetical protein